MFGDFFLSKSFTSTDVIYFFISLNRNWGICFFFSKLTLASFFPKKTPTRWASDPEKKWGEITPIRSYKYRVISPVTRS